MLTARLSCLAAAGFVSWVFALAGCTDDFPFDNPCDPLNAIDAQCGPPPLDAAIEFACPDADVDGEVCVAAPAFEIGTPPRQVELSYLFAISTHEVTRGKWREVMEAEPPDNPDCTGDTCPVTGVNWHEAADFCNRLTIQTLDTAPCYESMTGGSLPPNKCFGYRMATEAEWERVATLAWDEVAAQPHAFARLAPAAGCIDAGDCVLRPVGMKGSAWGVSDLWGNAEEWLHDPWREDRGTTSRCLANPYGGSRGGSGEATERVVRGGDVQTSVAEIHPTARSAAASDEAGPLRGFRWARTIEEKDVNPCQ